MKHRMTHPQQPCNSLQVSNNLSSAATTSKTAQNKTGQDISAEALCGQAMQAHPSTETVLCVGCIDKRSEELQVRLSGIEACLLVLCDIYLYK